MKQARRQRNKKKFGNSPQTSRPERATVKIKPKEEEPCTTKNPRPKKKNAVVYFNKRLRAAARKASSGQT